MKFFSWMEEAKPTWYTAVPTMHQAILSRAERNRETIKAHPLRFIRSSSASLPVPVFTQLEATFSCPVIEAYAMTENAHQMTSNQLPPGKRKPGFVGAAAGPDVAVMAPDGRLLAAHEEGEVVTRGPNVTKGYESNPAANETAFAHGWFHTGDQGFMDEDGFLKITGRLKEIINRGGEKIAPVEVDEVLMDHPAVHQAVTFAMPHDKLGEDVAAAIVLKEGMTCERARAARSRSEAARRFQSAAPHHRGCGNPEGRNRQIAAHRPRAEARARMTKICIFGAGAIGGYVGAQTRRQGRSGGLARGARRSSRGHESQRSDAQGGRR